MSKKVTGTSSLADLILVEPVPLTAHPVALYLDSLSPGSRRTMKQSLSAIASLLTQGTCDAYTLDWSKLRYQHTAAIRSSLQKNYSPATANKMLCALRRVLKEALRLDLIDPLVYAKAVDLPNFKESDNLKGRALTREEIQALIASCNSENPQDIRDGALIAILRGTGLRRAEITNLAVRDFDSETGAICVREGKGGKNRMVYLPSSAMPFLEKWLTVRGKKSGPLICRVRKAGQIQLTPLTCDGILKIMKNRALLAGIKESLSLIHI